MGYKNDVLTFRHKVRNGEFFVFDTETTGLSAVEHDVIEFSAIRYREENGKYVKVDQLDQFINPGYHIPDEITKITGITDAQVASMPKKEEAAHIIRNYLGEHPVVVGYNSLGFDQFFMNALYMSIGETFNPEFHLDVIKMAREKTPKPHKLINMAERFGLADGVAFHTSIADAEVTFGVMVNLLPLYENEEPAEKIGITGISRWTRSESLDRAYVNNTARKSIYFDIPKREWVGADDGIVEQVYAYLQVSSEEEFLTKI